jgi:uncharacterized membrane protein YraQ (UPF0718 family)
VVNDAVDHVLEDMILLGKFTVPVGWAVILRRTSQQIYRGQCFGWAAALAYYSFLAVFPALLFVVSIASLLPIQSLIDGASVRILGRRERFGVFLRL